MECRPWSIALEMAVRCFVVMSFVHPMKSPTKTSSRSAAFLLGWWRHQRDVALHPVMSWSWCRSMGVTQPTPSGC
eukprot:13122708-Ditylum_brightwellii.AAC.1